MAVGLGLLRLAPDHFWAMTTRELAAAVGHQGRPGAPLDRRALDRLADLFPDEDPPP
jgi:uncharacterized phage protein (TIGR02216 family)